MKLVLLSFIGIAINIWRDIGGTGGGGPPGTALRQRDEQLILQRDNQFIELRS